MTFEEWLSNQHRVVSMEDAWNAALEEAGKWGCNHPLDAGGCDFARIAAAIREMKGK